MNINLEKESLASIHALVEHVAGPDVAKIVSEYAAGRFPRKQKANQHACKKIASSTTNVLPS
jgi:hypothetical protein